MTPRTATLDSLTGVRGIAAWFVVLYHVRSGMGGYLAEPIMSVLAKGYLAVDLFFMLSGFVLWLNYAEPLRARGLAAAPGFYWRRIARVWPLHAMMLAGLAAFALVLIATGRPDDTNYPLSKLPLHLAMLQNWGFTGTLSWNHPAWSISCEFAAYLLFPLLALAVDWRRFPSALLIAGIGVLALLAWRVIDTPGLGDDIARLGLWRCLIEFTMGTMVCALWQRWRDQPRAIGVAAGATTIAAMGWAMGLAETFSVPLLLAGLLALLALTDGARHNPLRARPIVWLGEVSYATYLAHFPLFILFKLAWVDDPAAIPPASIALFLALVLLVSALLYRWVEKPAQRALNRLGSRPRHAATA
ncbi:acyltransferase [Sphingomonas sp. LaA6.9]|uniref:acyltransferase family protein n=1 Tax=Sphingomonas sp. LaA6.9 TaxID=2919914 RepID=UPI001F4F21ED|nr:acyltransferase [Sphingomonas sp. LaA6.9]MCJ8159365.1 acyltransferase [Sphingomonas sp. LaA6.9]